MCAGGPAVEGTDRVWFGRLFGRDRELTTLMERLADPAFRLITVTGPPGVGKSHLVHAALRGLDDDARPPTRVLDLADVRDADEIWPCLGGATPEAAATAIGDAPLLLVLDDCDPVARGLASGLARLLAGCSRLTVLATGRVALNIRAERVHVVRPLPVGVDSPAARLFLDRMRSQYRPDYAADRGGASSGDAIAEICALLDGIPLAIEIVADAVGALSPAGLLERLRAGRYPERRHCVDVPARHRTVTTALAWGETVLTDDDQRLVRALSVFETVIDVRAAGQVAGLGTEEAAAGVESLVDKSLLIRAGNRGGLPEFHLPHLVRSHYLRELADDAEALAGARDGHVRRCLDFATAVEPGLRDESDVSHSLAATAERLPDIRAATRHLRARGDTAGAVRLLTALERSLPRRNGARTPPGSIAPAGRADRSGGPDSGSAARWLMAVFRWAHGPADTAHPDNDSAAMSRVRARVAGLTGRLLRLDNDTITTALENYPASSLGIESAVVRFRVWDSFDATPVALDTGETAGVPPSLGSSPPPDEDPLPYANGTNGHARPEPVQDEPAGADTPPGDGLTPRQHEIALLVTEGLTNRQIARRLGISEWTVVNHLRAVMRKLECASRVQVARAMQHAPG